MKIKRFEQIFEAYIDDDIFNHFVEDLADELDIEFETFKGYFNEESIVSDAIGDIGKSLYNRPLSDKDRFCYLLKINLYSLNFKSLKFRTELRFGPSPAFNDDKIYELFDMLRKISQRVDTYIQFDRQDINFFILSDEKVELNHAELYKLYTDLKNRLNTMRTDFAYSTIISFDDNKITIKSDSDFYTDQKLNLFLPSDIKKNFKITKKIEDGEVFNIIEEK